MCDKKLRQKRVNHLFEQVVVSNCSKKHNHRDRDALFIKSDVDYYTTLPSRGKKGSRSKVRFKTISLYYVYESESIYISIGSEKFAEYYILCYDIGCTIHRNALF